MKLLDIVNEIIELAETDNFLGRTDVSLSFFYGEGNLIYFVTENNIIKY
jgi:hypothetical protein